MESHPALEQVVQNTASVEGLKLVAALNDYVGDMSDHHILRMNQVPYLFFSCGRWAIISDIHKIWERSDGQGNGFEKVWRLFRMRLWLS